LGVIKSSAIILQPYSKKSHFYFASLLTGKQFIQRTFIALKISVFYFN
jgi:hypothetical protein